MRWLRRVLARLVPATRPLPEWDNDPGDFGCCALDDDQGIGHEGPCGWRCGMCMGRGYCLDCGGTGGPDDVQHCPWCEGAGSCPDWCVEGWRYEDPVW